MDPAPRSIRTERVSPVRRRAPAPAKADREACCCRTAAPAGAGAGSPEPFPPRPPKDIRWATAETGRTAASPRASRSALGSAVHAPRLSSFASRVRVQSESDQRGAAMSGTLALRQLGAGQSQRERSGFAFGGQNPGGETRKALLLIHARRQVGPVEIHCTAAARALEQLGVPTRAARNGLPGDAVLRVAALVVAKPRQFGVGRERRSARVGAQVARRQRRR